MQMLLSAFFEQESFEVEHPNFELGEFDIHALLRILHVDDEEIYEMQNANT